MISDKEAKGISKFMSFVLRHKPEEIGLKLDKNGWTATAELISKLNATGYFTITPEVLQHVVSTNAKQRFAFNADKTMIRASQGHSVAIDLDLVPVQPPAYLYHGTANKFVAAIMAEGLNRMDRRHVHLSADTSTARTVGGRHGKPVILQADAALMHADGFTFYLSANGVWLTDHVPALYLKPL
jgi:putative RNA 2'-phosphotransferase